MAGMLIGTIPMLLVYLVGQRFFVREVLLHLVETGAIVQEAGRWVPALRRSRLRS